MGPKPACFGAFSTICRFPKLELPSTHGHTNDKNILILENFRRSDQNLHFGESESNIWKIGNTHQDTKMYTYFGENIYFLQGKKNMCFISEKYTNQEKTGDLTMKANFI